MPLNLSIVITSFNSSSTLSDSVNSLFYLNPYTELLPDVTVWRLGNLRIMRNKAGWQHWK